MAFVVIVGASVAHYNVTTLDRETTQNIEIRNRLLVASRHVRDAVWQTRQSLAEFLLDPYVTKHRGDATAAIERARNLVDDLRQIENSAAHIDANLIDSDAIFALDDAIRRLQFAVNDVIATRLNAQQQYPSMSLANNELLPFHRDFYTAIGLAMEEIESEGADISHFEPYRRLVAARHLWTQLVSSFRMYLANRMGSFAQEGLHTQEQDVETLYHELLNQIDALKALSKTTSLGIQTDQSISQLPGLAEGWLRGFDAIKRLHASDDWRADAKKMKESIEPLFADIWRDLLKIDSAIERDAVRDVQELTESGETQTDILWFITAMGLVFVVAGNAALDRLVLRPLSRVSQALNAEAKGLAEVALPTAATEETKDLLDAFDKMRNKVHARQAVLEHQALHDALTSLPNRTLLFDRAQNAINAAKRAQGSLALMMLDLDRFKEINDTLGHDVGDRLLVEVGNRLVNTMREVDTIARLGGDEFCILLPGTDEAGAKIVASRTLEILEQKIDIDGRQLLVGASIGIALFPEHGITPQSMLQRADVAMYVAKRNKTGYALYNADDDQYSMRRLALISDLRDAIEHDELELHYQPKIETATNRVSGAEALLRWTHPKHGRIPPDQVIPLAEQMNLIRPLTHWVLNEALAQCERWRADGIDIHVAVNLSAYSLQDDDLRAWIDAWFAQHQLPTRNLVLEVTESAMMSNPVKAAQVLRALDAMGINIAIDDYGTGFSSLGYLKQLPIDELKIDKSFVMDMLKNENDRIIVRSTIELAHNLGLRVVAEGVENQEILELLTARHCDYAQGYHISRPVPATEFERWWRARRPTDLPATSYKEIASA